VLLKKEDVLFRNQHVLLKKEDVLLRNQHVLLKKEDVLLQKEDVLLRDQHVLLQKEDALLRNQRGLLQVFGGFQQGPGCFEYGQVRFCRNVDDRFVIKDVLSDPQVLYVFGR